MIVFPIRDTMPSRTTPAITRLIIASNVLIFLYAFVLGPWGSNHFVAEWGFIPRRLFRDPLDLVTSMFLHGGWMHLIGNMWFLWIFGDNVEDVLGHAKYFSFYLICGVAAALTQWALNPLSPIPMVGASGAISGVMGAYLLKFPHARIVMGWWIIIILTFELPAVVVLVYYFVLQLFSGAGSIADTQLAKGGTAYFAHIGGFVAGMILIKVMHSKPKYSHRRELYW